MLPPLPRHSDWWYCFAHPTSRISLPRNGHRVGLRVDLFEACSAFTHVAACTLALSPYFVTRLSEGFNHFVTSIVAPVASGWSGCRAGLAPAGKRRLCTAHATTGPSRRARKSWLSAPTNGRFQAMNLKASSARPGHVRSYDRPQNRHTDDRYSKHSSHRPTHARICTFSRAVSRGVETRVDVRCRPCVRSSNG